MFLALAFLVAVFNLLGLVMVMSASSVVALDTYGSSWCTWCARRCGRPSAPGSWCCRPGRLPPLAALVDPAAHRFAALLAVVLCPGWA